MWLPNYAIQLHLPYLLFVIALGGVVGSFLNVVILRLPKGENIISPPSHCPKCGHRLRWFENLPVVGYLFVRGRCTSCHLPISLQYPAIEALCALMFGAVFVLYYMVAPHGPTFINDLAPPWLARYGFAETWPILILHLLLLAALIGMTVIDLRTYTIPVLIPLFISVIAVPVHTLMPLWPGGGMRIPLEAPGVAAWIIPLTGPTLLGACLLGLVGIGISSLLLRRGRLRPSYLDFDLWVGPDDLITAYPYARREVEWELDYLGPVLLGLMAGGAGAAALAAGSDGDLPLWAGALGGSLLGWFVGFGIVWAIRLLGTIGFGKEAMGLGDAYLLAAVGACLGWVDVVLIFFIAPFFGIAGAILQRLVAPLLESTRRGGMATVPPEPLAPVAGAAPAGSASKAAPTGASAPAPGAGVMDEETPWWRMPLPYGPWLALATVVVMFGDVWLARFLSVILQMPVSLP